MGELTSEQQSALAKLRSQVKDVLPNDLLEDDNFLLRWLRARNYEVAKSEKMLRESMQWRKQNNADNTLKEYKVPDILKKYYSFRRIGSTKKGHPVLFVKMGKIDYRGILQCLKKSEFDKYFIWAMEDSMQAMRDNTKRLGKYIGTHYFILDSEGFSLRQVASKQVMSFFKNMVMVNENNYPETLEKVMIVNASQVFTIAHSLLKPLMSEATSSKLNIFSTSDTAKWKEILLEDIDADVLPVHWGGTRTDSTGKPWCPELIPEGGPIPEECMQSPGKKLADIDGTETITVASGSSALVEADIDIPNAILKWIFGTNGHDIAFGVYRKTAAGLEEHLPKERVTSHVIAEEGELECIEPGTYVLAFDNSHSVLRSKTVTFRVEVLPPDDEFSTAQL